MDSAARLLLYVGALIAGGEACAQWVHGASWSTRSVTALRPRAVGAWVLVLVALTLLFVLQFLALELAPTAADVAMLVRQTTWGRDWAILAGTGALGVIAAFTMAPLGVRTVLATALAIAMGGLGHAAADEGAPVLARALDAVHVIAIALWLGTLACLGRGVSAEGWRRFSRVAGVAAPLTILTGVATAWRRVGDQSVTHILAGDYGRLLAVKLSLVAVIVLLGAKHRRQVQQQASAGAGSVRVELAFALATLVVTAVLTGSSES